MGKLTLRKFIGIAVLSTLGAAGLEAADVTGSNPTVDPTIGTQLPPTFDANMAQQLSASLGSCFNVGGQIQGIGDALQGKAVNPNGSCGPDEVPGMGRASCREFENAAGAFDEAKYAKKEEKLKQVEAAISCKKAKFDGLQQEVSCMMNQAQALQSQISSLQTHFQNNIQRMQSDVAIIKAAEEDRKGQLEDVTNKLGGNKNNGAQGLLALKEKTQQLVNQQMPAQILKVREGFKQVEQLRKGLEEQVATRKISLTNECFSTRSGPGFQCVPNGPPVSVREYVLCRFEQNQNLGEGGVIERNEMISRQAAARRGELQAVLDSILGDSAKTLMPDPRNPNGPPQNLNQAVTILTVQDIESQYGDKLASFNGKGLNIHDFVMGQMRGCFARAEKVVARERKMASSPVGVAEATFKQQERATQSEINSMIETYSQQFSENMAGLTGNHMPLNTSACKSANPNTQINCLEDIRRNMEGLLNGNVPQSTMNINLPAQDPKRLIRFSCQGLSGCVTALQNISTGLDREVKRLGQFKKDYVLKANQNVENFANSMARTLSPQSGMLQEKIKQLNAKLGALGVRPINLKPLQGEKLEKDEDGLPQTPKNVLALVGSQMTPPMVDMHGEEFSRGMEEIAKGTEKLGEKSARLAEAAQELAEAKATCQGAMLAKARERIMKKFEKANECAKTYDGCKVIHDLAGNGKLSLLTGDLTDILGGSDDFDADSALDSGVGDCMSDSSSKMSEYERIRGEIARLKDQKKGMTSKDDATALTNINSQITDLEKEQKDLFGGGTASNCGSLGSVSEFASKEFDRERDGHHGRSSAGSAR